jgi:hypothetical protein
MAHSISDPKQTRPAFVRWLFEGHNDEGAGAHTGHAHPVHPWWKVMCLTGVDYFSTLGYQPGIAALAAGALSPIATLILVLLTLFGALPVYNRVAQESPHGEGSIAMLESLLTWWQGKLFVLALLGFVATDFVITITLSAADATAHLLENPIYEHTFGRNPHAAVPVTLVLVGLLGAIFLKGFKEAVGIAVVLVLVYLFLNGIVVFHGVVTVLEHPEEFSRWKEALSRDHGGNPVMLFGLALLLFPKLALGLSGFETGVAVMPLIKGEPSDKHARPAGRIKNTRKLLLTAALIMSVFLVLSSIVTTFHIPAAEFQPGGKANGRALAYLAHQFFGDTFGTIYDISTILILWFAGASAMAGLLNIVPRYLPRYGMAPEWTRAMRPLVLVFTAIAFLITIIFRADVDAQGGAYATGVLVLMSSAAVAVTIAAAKRNQVAAKYGLGIISLVFAYTTVVNCVERPDGLKIASFFIGSIILVSLISRVWRTLELRVDRVDLDGVALNFLRDAAESSAEIRIVPNHPEKRDLEEYIRQDREARADHQMPEDAPLLFLEVDVKDASNFSGILKVRGFDVGGYRVLRAEGSAVPNGIAALLLHLQRLTGRRPHVYFNWGESSPILFLIRYLLSGQGDIAPVTREILRRVEPDPDKRPVVHAAA